MPGCRLVLRLKIEIMDSRRYRAALIDMDGVLYDSMPGHTLAWQKMMQREGVDCNREEFYQYEGMTGAATIDLLFRREFGHGVSAEKAKELYAVKSAYFKEMGDAPVMPGAQRMIKALGALGLIRILVTGSGQSSLLDKLERDYSGVFIEGRRITAHDVTHGKPDPEPYLKGAKLAGAAPEECIVIENAPLGVKAGRAAGCFVIAVTTGPIPRRAFEEAGADLIFDSMNQFADWLEERVKDKECDGANPFAGFPLIQKLKRTLERYDYDRLLVITDRNVNSLWNVGVLKNGLRNLAGIEVIEPGEQSKNIGEAVRLWRAYVKAHLTRNSIIINIGGGVVSDLGGFAASVFKRGIRYLNVPTTILAMADASIGGKTGVDFEEVKNEIGTFRMPEDVIIQTSFLSTLSYEQKLDGIAEVMKSALLSSREFTEMMLETDNILSDTLLYDAVEKAADFKKKIVREDPHDKGIRRILNFGHTAGHAFESVAKSAGINVGHGMAVAHGMLVALILSHRHLSLEYSIIEEYNLRFLRKYYPALTQSVLDDEKLLTLMMRDKKNRGNGKMSFVLLKAPGEPVEAYELSKSEVTQALLRYREMSISAPND